jgi:hypothetical protein
MSEHRLLDASSKQEKLAIPFSLNDRTTEFLDYTANDE